MGVKKIIMDMHAFNFETIKKEISKIKSRIQKKGVVNKSDQQLLELLDGLIESAYGRYLLQHRRVNGQWINYQKDAFHQFEKFIFNQSPAFLAMSLRHQSINQFLKECDSFQKTIGIYPSSYLSEWTFFQNEHKATLIGLNSSNDLDENFETFDFLIRNIFLYGDRDCDSDLYTEFYSCLKPGGTLIVSVWNYYEGFPKEYFLKEELLFQKLLGMAKCSVSSFEEVEERLRDSGFVSIKCMSGRDGMLMTFLAKKPMGDSSKQKAKRIQMHLPRRLTKKGVCF